MSCNDIPSLSPSDFVQEDIMFDIADTMHNLTSLQTHHRAVLMQLQLITKLCDMCMMCAMQADKHYTDSGFNAI